MSVLAMAVVMAIGVAMVQDGVCSIMFYIKNPKERWFFNHSIRLVRAGAGVILIIISVMALR